MNPKCVPTVLFYGDMDQIVDDENQGKLLFDRLQSAKVKSDFSIIANATHEMHGKMPQVVNSSVNFWKSVPQ